MNKLIKKVLVGVIAGTMMLGSVCTAFAATGSQTEAPSAPVRNEEPVKATNGSEAKTSATGKATVTSVKKTSAKSVTVSSTVKIDGISYKVTRLENKAFANAPKATKVTLPSTITSLGAQAFTGAKSLKTIVIKSTKAVKVNKDAFKGVNTKKMTIKVTSMSKKELKAFKKQLKKAGFKGTVKLVK